MLDRHFWLALLLTAAVVIPRSISIARAHSESYDDQYHLVRGLAQWRGDHLRIEYNDPPLGEMILAFPLWVTGCTVDAPARDPSVIAHQADPTAAVLYGQPVSPERLLVLVSAWKAVLFLPGAAIVFIWCRRLYGVGSAWLAIVALLAEPTIAAHTSVIALDVLGAEAILAACYFTWRYFESTDSSIARFTVACIAIAAALMIKQTALMVLPACMGYALLQWRRRPIAPRRNRVALAVLLVTVFIWIFSCCDFSRPNERSPVMSTRYTEHWGFGPDVVNANLGRRWPAGIYLASLVNGLVHSAEGHHAYLLGEVSMHGRWYYQPVAAAVKVPVGIAVLILLGMVSIGARRVRFEEWSLLLPAIIAIGFLLVSGVSIGFRHAIPCYILVIMWASRCAQQPSSAWLLVPAWLGVLATAIQGAMWHPDEQSFTNGLWRHPERIISDSNLDWGQSLKEIRAWVDAHPQSNRPVYGQLFLSDTHGVGFDHYLAGRVQWLGDAPPDQGLLIVSPVMVWGGYVPGEWFEKVRDRKPIAIIGHTIRVYDLDQIR